MKELMIVPLEEKVKLLISTIFNRGYVEQMVSTENFNDEIHALIRGTQETYLSQALHGDLSVDTLIDDLQVRDEEILHEIAELIIKESPDLKYYDYVKEKSYEDMIDQIMNGFIIDYEISIFCVCPAISKNNIPYLITWSLDSNKDAYFVLDPPPGSFQEYMSREPKCEIYYNDCQNILIDECKITDDFDNSTVFIVRRLKEKSLSLEASK